MKPLVLKLKRTLTQRIDFSPITPNALAGLDARQIAALPLWVAKDRVPLGELFEVESGEPDEIHIKASGARLDSVGAAMENGRILLEGDAGDYLGQGMKSGEILVQGSCGAYAATGMRGGTLLLQGDAGDFLGAAMPGESHGLKGGLVLVKGNAGDRIGDHQRRGSILIEGNAGDYCGARMHAGTIAVLGSTGQGTGYAMRRGSILLSRLTGEVPASFYDAGECDLTFLTLMIASWKRLDSRFAHLERWRKRVRRLAGDMSCGGKGEILIWAGGDVGLTHPA